MTTEKKKKKVFTSGPISAAFIGDSIQKHTTKTTIGAHDIFLGQVRADVINGKTVSCIEYTAQEELAEETFHTIREDAFSKFNLTCMHIYHSLGKVNAGEICLFVFVSAPHRADAFEACRYITERIKKEVAIWGKEYFEDESYQWKANN
jgi:molybdopterin synthase catalytic subunit